MEGGGQTVGEEGDGPGCVGLWARGKISVRPACDAKALEGVEQGGE